MFKNNLKRERLYNGLSQKDLAKSIGTGTRNIKKLETGEVYPAVKTIYKLSTVLKIDFKELIGMIKFEVKPVVSDYGIFENGKLRLIINDLNNALMIRNILENDNSESEVNYNE